MQSGKHLKLWGNKKIKTLTFDVLKQWAWPILIKLNVLELKRTKVAYDYHDIIQLSVRMLHGFLIVILFFLYRYRSTLRKKLWNKPELERHGDSWCFHKTIHHSCTNGRLVGLSQLKKFLTDQLSHLKWTWRVRKTFYVDWRQSTDLAKSREDVITDEKLGIITRPRL